MSPQSAHAADLNITDITVQTDIYINGKKDNFLRIGKDGTASVEVVLTLIKPARVQFGVDKVVFAGSSTPNKTITGFGATGTARAANGAGACYTETNNGIAGYDSTKYIKCDGPLNNFQGANQSIVRAGEVMYRNTFQITGTSIANLGISQVKTQTTSGLNEFYIYPGVQFDKALTPNDFISFITAGKSIFAELYDTQALAIAAASNAIPRCSSTVTTNCVPEYGAATGTGQNTTGGDSGLLGLINKIIMFLLGLINEFVYFVFYWLIAPILQAVLSIHTYTDTFVNVIYPGWEVVRNVCNIFFIVAIIAIAMATLLRVEGYQFRHLLVQLIMAALLVNFSLVIAQAILALADTIQSQFLPNNVDVIRSLARDLMVSNVRDAVWNLDITKYGSFSQTITFLFWVALALGSFAVFTGLAAMLVIRIVALWVLLMVSPVAYVAGVIPSTAGMKQEWWSAFLKYAFFTPVIAFFLNMTAKISETVRNQELLQKVTGADFRDSNSPELTAFVFKVFSNILLLVFLMVAIKVADSFGIYGANIVSDVAKGGILAPFKLAGGGIGAGLRKLNEIKQEKSSALVDKGRLGRLAFSVLNPTMIAKAREERAEERRGHIEHRAQGAATDVIDTFFNTSHGDTVEHSFVHGALDKAKEMPKGSERVAAGVLKQIAHQGKTDLNAQLELMGALNNMAEEKGMNYVLGEAKNLGLSDKNYETTAKGYVQFLNDIQRKFKIREKDMAGMTVELGKSAYSNKEYWYAEMAGVDGHGHAKMIKTTADGKIEGEEEYKKVMAADEVYKEIIGAEDEKGDKMSLEQHVDFRLKGLILQRQAELAEREGKKIDELSPEELASVIESKEVRDERKAVRTKLNNKYIKTLQDKDHGEDPLFVQYDNWRGFLDGQKESFINFSKLAPQTRARDGHWNTQVNISPEGKYALSYHGLEHILKADKGDFGQGDQMPLRKREALIQAFTEEKEDHIQERLVQELEKIEVSKMYNAGIDSKVIKDVQDSDDFKNELNRIASEKIQNYKKHYIGGERIGETEVDDPANPGKKKKIDTYKVYEKSYVNKVTTAVLGYSGAVAPVTTPATAGTPPSPPAPASPGGSPPSGGTPSSGSSGGVPASGTGTSAKAPVSGSKGAPAGTASAGSPAPGTAPAPAAPPLAPSPASPSPSKPTP